MTLVIARRCGDRIIVVSDTMISDDNGTGNDIIPGQLKTVVIHRYASLSFAGRLTIGLEAARKAKSLLACGQVVEAVIEFLRRENIRSYERRETETDFVFSTHLNGAGLYKIWNGGLVTPVTDRTWIGNPEAASLIDEIERGLPAKVGSNATTSRDELRFMMATAQVAMNPAELAAVGVGGLFTIQLGSLHGHSYVGSAGSGFGSVFTPWSKDPGQRGEAIGRYGYRLVSPRERGAAVLGALVEEAKTGFIFCPLEHDDPIRLFGATEETLFAEASRLARLSGGQIIENEWL